jgi:hypothetical protein
MDDREAQAIDLLWDVKVWLAVAAIVSVIGLAAYFGPIGPFSEMGRLERQYANVAKLGQIDLQCEVAGEIRNAAAKSGDRREFDRWSETAQTDCAMVRIRDYAKSGGR